MKILLDASDIVTVGESGFTWQVLRPARGNLAPVGAVTGDVTNSRRPTDHKNSTSVRSPCLWLVVDSWQLLRVINKIMRDAQMSENVSTIIRDTTEVSLWHGEACALTPLLNQNNGSRLTLKGWCDDAPVLRYLMMVVFDVRPRWILSASNGKEAGFLLMSLSSKRQERSQ